MSQEIMTGAQAIIRSLELLGVDTIFGLPGGAILPTYDPLMDSKQIRHILVRHEQGAVMRPRVTRAQPASSVFASQPLALVQPTWSPQLQMHTWIAFRCSQSPVRSAVT